MKEGTFVRWKEHSNRLYYVIKMNVRMCGRNDAVKIESIDHKWIAITYPECLTIDDQKDRSS